MNRAIQFHEHEMQSERGLLLPMLLPHIRHTCYCRCYCYSRNDSPYQEGTFWKSTNQLRGDNEIAIEKSLHELINSLKKYKQMNETNKTKKKLEPNHKIIETQIAKLCQTTENICWRFNRHWRKSVKLPIFFFLFFFLSFNRIDDI